MTWINGRRHVDIRAWHSARQEHAALVAERDALKAENETLKRQWTWLMHELDDVRASLREARMKAEFEVAELYRQREIARAQAVERDLTTPLQ